MRKPIAGAALTLALAIPVMAAGTSYQDVPGGAWYAGAVAYCQEHALMAGTDETHFNPGGALTRRMTASWAGESEGDPAEAITREELAVLLWQAAGAPDNGAELPFADADKVSPEAVQAAAWANAEGLITGKPNARLDPLAAVTRAEAATILMRRAGVAFLSEGGFMDASFGANGIAAMEDGSVLVTDLYNKKIWRVNDGKAEVYAGGDTVKDIGGRPVGGYHDAKLLESYFGEPWAIAPYRDGWAVSDASNNALRLLAGGTVTTLNQNLAHPTGLAADGAGNLYISDTFSGTIRKLDAKGTLTIAAGGLSDPMGLCWRDGVLYIAETGANRVSRLDGTKLTVAAGSGADGCGDGAAEMAAFSAPTAVTVADDGTIYVSDTGNSSIRRIRDGWVNTVAARDYSTEDLRLIDPSGLLLQGDTLLVCDSFAQTILELPVG